MSAPDWKDALPAPPHRARLKEAWLTTFDQPDASLLVEHLLPSLLSANHTLSQDPKERALFFGELGTSLEALRGRITIISSPPREARQPSPYPWLWRYVNHFTVGAQSRAVQHAKFWAFHWQIDDDEILELHISSTNLTTSAFKKQIQAGWSVSLEIQQNFKKTRQTEWGELVPFLVALGESAGKAKESINRLIQLLGKTEAPDGVTFVASTPQSKKGAALQLKNFGVSAIHILSPTIGDWGQKSLTDWSNDLGVCPENIHLKWIDANHPWSSSGGWTLTKKARSSLQSTGVKLNHLGSDARFADAHVDGDERWSHAKLYLLKVPRKKNRYLLVTSANWSPAAWGAGKESPRNFELGVLFETDWKMLEDIEGDLLSPFCIERNPTGESKLQWAEATWDGKRITLQARSSDTEQITAVVRYTGKEEKKHNLNNGVVEFECDNAFPLTALFAQGNETLEVDVIDLRPPAEFAKTPLPEVDPLQQQALRDAFLLERYGGSAVDPDTVSNSGATKNGKSKTAGTAAFSSDYSVPAWLDARAGFEVLDNWRRALNEIDDSDTYRREQVLLDGEQLQGLYKRRNDAATSLVAEEFGWRLEETK